jgi:hypothetical protein
MEMIWSLVNSRQLAFLEHLFQATIRAVNPPAMLMVPWQTGGHWRHFVGSTKQLG